MEKTSEGLRASLTLWDTTMLVMGGIIGAGIFFTPAAIAELQPSLAGILLMWGLGGVLALTDLLLGEGLSARVSRRIAPLFGVPRGSLRTEAEYRAALAGAGFLEVVIRDRTEDVLGGFARWARGGGSGSGPGGPRLTRMGLSATGRMAGLLAGSGGLRYVIVTAHRGEG